ncbi:peptidase M24A, methionine aminopeptidase [Violaceomyces palustris]|uniref:Peptidase M24A, methionine aminopeptidase n=1 Tax=Violaceomyces palustris TaxID=1673888 RepID=A0ACD0P3A4_9BASI|nr:peptidase M24A, methionine aminopeptidase [Violaceomyces palustris]
MSQSVTTDKIEQKLEATSLENGSNGHEEKLVNHNAADDESADEDDEPTNGDATQGGGGTGSSKNKKKKKKSGAAKRKAKAANSNPVTQTEPPRVGITKIFPDGIFPVGEIQQYDESKFDESRKRVTAEELRERERLTQQEEGFDYNLIRRAAEVHRQVRRYAQNTVKPGMSMIDIAEIVEDGTRALVEANGFESGIGFPTGVSLNECAAHYTPNAGDKRILQSSDVLKIDFGVHVMGRIVDSAFTMTFEETHNPLLEAVRAATNEGIKQAGIDVRLGEVGAAIQEVMESHEYDVNGKTLKVKCIQNLNGHSIERYSIHGGKSVPIVAMPNLDVKMEEGEYFAIETFGSTGRGYVQDQGDCSHYARKAVLPKNLPIRVTSARPLLRTISNNFGSLPFCRRYLDRTGEKNYLLGLKHLVQLGVVQDYPPLCDIPGAMTAQYEHTILLRPTCKEVVSRGDDY